MYPKEITDYRGKLYLGGNDGEIGGAPFVFRMGTGGAVGCYIDDTTPDRNYWVQTASEKWAPKGGLVLLAHSPNDRSRIHLPAVVNLQEWYPYGEGIWWWQWGPIPVCAGYILQWRFPGVSDHRPPTLTQRHALLARVLTRRPRFVFLY